MASTPAPLVTPRDLDVFQALDRCPLTARQLLRLSRTFERPFTSERKLRARLHLLAAAGRVCRWPLAIAGRGGSPNYYTLSRRGYFLLYGAEAQAPSRRAFRPVGIAHQQHTHALAEFIVHTAVAAHAAGITLTDFQRENTVCLHSGEEHIYPDCTFTLRTPDRQEFHFFVEIDNGTERVHSTKDAASWARKIRVYEAVQDRSPHRFRVLIIPTRQGERTAHLLGAAAALAANPQRSLFYAASLPDYLAQPVAVTRPCFLDHRGQAVALVTPIRHGHNHPPVPDPAAFARFASPWYAPAPAQALLAQVRAA